MWKGEWKFYAFVWPGGLVWALILIFVAINIIGRL
jgi:hypothetical protein